MNNSKARQVFSDNLKRIATEKGITQADIVLKIKCSSSTASDWFSGKKYPRPDKMQKIADILDVYLSDLTSEKKESIPQQEDELSDKDIRLLNWFRSLPKEKQEAILIAQDGPTDLV